MALIIAEAGVNHNGDINMAKKLVDVAKEAGVDIVKFQTGVDCASKFAPKAKYQTRETGEGSQIDMIKKISLTLEEHGLLFDYCNKVGIPYLSTPFDVTSVKYLNGLNLPFWKIPSGEITNLPYLIKIAETKKPVVMSTGMAEISEIKDAIDILRSNGTPEITLLQCHTDYPTQMKDVNLRAMLTLKDIFNVPVGFSDHSLGIEVPIAAVAMGATIIEKHFTLDKTLPGPDHKASLEPDELAKMVKAIRNIEVALGDGVKKCSDAERDNIIVVRKSIVAKRDIKKGEIFTEENITTRRPGNGISPMKWNEILGTYAQKDYAEDELI